MAGARALTGVIAFVALVPLQSQLGQQARHVVLHGLLGQEHGFGDLPIRHPLADQREHAPFLVGERGESRIQFRSAPDSFEHPRGHRRVE